MSDANEKQVLENYLKMHQKDAEDAYEYNNLDIQKGVNEKSRSVLTLDLKQCLPTPDNKTSVVFYKCQLWTINLTVHRCDN